MEDGSTTINVGGLRKLLPVIVVVVFTLVCMGVVSYRIVLGTMGPSDPLLRAHYIMARTPVIDGHNDFVSYLHEYNATALLAMNVNNSKVVPTMHTDIPRLKAGRVGAQFWSVWTSCSLMSTHESLRQTIEKITTVKKMAQVYPEVFKFALTSSDVVNAIRTNKIASLIGMEGGHSIDNSLDALQALYTLGARYLSLTHDCHTNWARAANGKPNEGPKGLTKFGREVVAEMNRLGMMVDLSHAAPQTMLDVLNVTKSPVIFSHSNAYEICKSARNVPDDVLKLVKKNKGIVMVTFVAYFTREEEREKLASLYQENANATYSQIRELFSKWRADNPDKHAKIEHLIEHIDHIVKVAGIDHVGIGGDFDGVSHLVDDLSDVSKYPNLVAGLIKKGYKDADIQKILYKNIIRVMQDNEVVARKLRASSPIAPVVDLPHSDDPVEEEEGSSENDNDNEDNDNDNDDNEPPRTNSTRITY